MGGFATRLRQCGAVTLLVTALSGCDATPEGPSLTELAAQRADLGGDAVSMEAIPPTDLPPEGTRSLFDHIIMENGALPFPFEEVIRLVASYDPEGRPPITLMIPDGRSLLKGQADFYQPRIVVAATAEPGGSEAMLAPMLKGRLFLGFVEGADEIEIISYNEKAGRFEFQLVKDYAEGKVPKLVYAKRAICTTCHIGSGPIFPTRPWEETTAQPAIRQAIIESRGNAEPYHGAKVDNKLNDAEEFDALTDKGNLVPVTQRLWLDGCGAEGAACRQQMLSLALQYLWDPASFDAQSAEARKLRELQSESWPQAGIPLDNGDLLNRNPFTDHPADYNWMDWIASWFRDERQRAHREVPEDTVAAFEALPRLRPSLDPLTPRLPKKTITADDLDGVYGLAQMFVASDRQLLERLSGYRIASLQAALKALPADTWAAAPVSRVDIMQRLVRELGHTPPGHCCVDTEGMSAPMVGGVPPLEISPGSVLVHFETYCFGCHRGNPSAQLDFMNGETEAEVLARIREVAEIPDVLDFERYLGTDKEARLMPPARSYQRRLLDQSMEKGEDHREEMVKAVPSLFDF